MRLYRAAYLASLMLLAHIAMAQPGGQFQGANALNANGLNGLGNPQNAGGPNPDGGQGGSANADFETLIDLIVSTVSPETWAETGGGDAEIRPFPTGVWVDPEGVLQQVSFSQTPAKPSPSLAPRSEARPQTSTDPHTPAHLRCVSLTRLEAEIERRMIAREPLEESMLVLAGLQRVQHVFVYPDTSEIVLAGPAGDWTVDDERRLVSIDSGHAVPRLDDLLVLLRRETNRPGEPFGCAITPRRERLAAVQRYLNDASLEPLAPGRRARIDWLEGARDELGRQDVEVFGLDPSTNAARVLVEADHHMKRVGLGDANGAPGLASYLDRAADLPERESLSVLRWWFAMNYDGVSRSEDRSAYHLRGQAVKVLSENELLTARGERVHTGVSDGPTEGFARDFTARFEELCQEHPVYGELRNLFDLALVAALIRQEGLLPMVGWDAAFLLDSERLPLPRHRVAREVDTLATHRLLPDREILAAVSGGVWADAAEEIDTEADSSSQDVTRPAPPQLSDGAWWWDVE